MRKATIALIGAALLTPSCALATTFTAPNRVKAAVREADVVQTVRYVCSRGSNGRKCYHVSPRPRQPSANWGYGLFSEAVYWTFAISGTSLGKSVRVGLNARLCIVKGGSEQRKVHRVVPDPSVGVI
jgi:hypothetical protein